MRFSVIAFALLGLGACGTSGGSVGPADGGDGDAGADAGEVTDASVPFPNGDPSTFPAFAPEMPSVIDDKGAKLTAARIVTVTWSTDPLADKFNALGDTIGTSDFWKGLSEYGIGPASSGSGSDNDAGSPNHVTITDPPPMTISDTDLDAFVSAHVGAAPANGWPVNDPQTVYAIYLPPTTMLTTDGVSCDEEDGYHSETAFGSDGHIVYAVIIQSCADAVGLDATTQTAAHELVESVTDPHTNSDTAWGGFDTDHYAWEVWMQEQDEIADACENFDLPDINETTTAFPFSIQRYWSNAAAKLGKNPCVPHSVEPYYNVAPLDVSPVAINDHGHKVTTRGYHIPVGTTATIHLGFYTDAARAAWSLQVYEGDSLSPLTTTRLKLTVDKTTGNNGDVAAVSVTVLSSDKTAPFSMVTAVSNAKDGPERYMPFLIETD